MTDQTANISSRDYRALSLRKAIQLWIKSGILVNSAYTPKAMARNAEDITGFPYKTSKKSLQKAVNDISALYPGVCKP